MNLTVDSGTRVNKQWWLNGAEIIDAWRVIPRALIVVFCVWFAYTTDFIIHWYASLSVEGQTTQVSTFCGAVFGVMGTMAGYVFKVYTSGGRSWDQLPAISSSTVSQTTITK